MATLDWQRRTSERATKLALMGVFTGILAAVAPARKSNASPLTALDAGLRSFATFRAGRMLAYDEVAEPLREPFAETVEDDSGAGLTTESKGQGSRKVIGDLLTCPVCAGTWAAAGMVYGLRIAPGPTRLLITIFGAAGAAELLNGTVEALQWHAQVQRKEAGRM